MRYNHAMTLSYAVESENPMMPSYEEALAALLVRVASILADRGEGREALLSEAPFDTYEVSE